MATNWEKMKAEFMIGFTRGQREPNRPVKSFPEIEARETPSYLLIEAALRGTPNQVAAANKLLKLRDDYQARPLFFKGVGVC